MRQQSAHRLRLLIEIGILPARHLVAIDLGARRQLARFERQVETAHAIPVFGGLVQRVEIHADVALAETQALDQRVEVRLARHAGQRAERGIDDIDPFVGS
jgi:hypothetical protein